MPSPPSRTKTRRQDPIKDLFGGNYRKRTNKRYDRYRKGGRKGCKKTRRR